MASPSIQILALTPPSATNLTLTTTLLPTSLTNNILNPSTSLSFEFRNGSHEVFLDRITHRELAINDDGSVMATVPNVPIFKTVEDGSGRMTEVRMYAWKGDKLLGEWEVGSF